MVVLLRFLQNCEPPPYSKIGKKRDDEDDEEKDGNEIEWSSATSEFRSFWSSLDMGSKSERVQEGDEDGKGQKD